jgi:hypothetical protein
MVFSFRNMVPGASPDRKTKGLDRLPGTQSRLRLAATTREGGRTLRIMRGGPGKALTEYGRDRLSEETNAIDLGIPEGGRYSRVKA